MARAGGQKLFRHIDLIGPVGRIEKRHQAHQQPQQDHDPAHQRHFLFYQPLKKGGPVNSDILLLTHLSSS